MQSHFFIFCGRVSFLLSPFLPPIPFLSKGWSWLLLPLFFNRGTSNETREGVTEGRGWQLVMKLFRCCTLWYTAKSISLKQKSVPGIQLLYHHQICLPWFFSHWHRPQVGSQEVSLPPPPPSFPCKRETMAQPSAPRSVGKYWVLGEGRGTPGKGRKKKKKRGRPRKKKRSEWGNEREEEKMRPARFGEETHNQMYLVVVFTQLATM